MHQNGSAAQCGAGGGHARVPEMAADVVDDFGPGLDGELRGAVVEGVDGWDGVRPLFEDGFEDWEEAGVFFFPGERGGVGAGGFAADVEDLPSFVEHLP